jgi:hypothetical protein
MMRCSIGKVISDFVVRGSARDLNLLMNFLKRAASIEEIPGVTVI